MPGKVAAVVVVIRNKLSSPFFRKQQMKKLSLAVIGLYIGLLSAFAQKPAADSSLYKNRKLTFEEANFVSSYYKQDGNNSAVTGGIGTEKLTDLSNTIDIKLKKYDKLNRKNIFDFELGIDHYTSASSDKIDPSTISSASYADTRIYPSLNWTRENEQKGTTIGAGISASAEYDYSSIGANINFAKKVNHNNGEFSARLQTFQDNVKLILPIELRPNTGGNRERENYGSSPRRTYSAAFGYTQVVNQRLQLAFLLDLIYQQGYLGLPFHRIYFLNNTEGVENLPGKRLKVPLGFRANYFAGDKVVIRTYYRYYQDDWGLKAHTINIETPVKLTPFVSVSPFYRYYSQQGVDYFAPYKAHKVTDQFYTSNYDLSTFHSSFYGAGIRLAPPDHVFGINHLASLELRYGHYTKNIGMQSDIVSLNLGFK